MNKEQRLNLFKPELGFITNGEVLKFTETVLENLPDYFFEVPASSTGKYHPKFSLGEGGLVRHTKCAVQVANELFTLEMFAPLKEDKDYVIAALILHDGLKSGEVKQTYTVANHPVLVAEKIIALGKKHNFEEGSNKIADLIMTHMGQWNECYKTKKEIMPKPSTKLQNLVHLCDYIASRKIWDGFYN